MVWVWVWPRHLQGKKRRLWPRRMDLWDARGRPHSSIQPPWLARASKISLGGCVYLRQVQAACQSQSRGPSPMCIQKSPTSPAKHAMLLPGKRADGLI